RLSARRSAEAVRAQLAREVRAVLHVERPAADAGPALSRAEMAVPRGAAYRRGDAPVDAAHGRHVRPRAAEPERRAASADRPVEVRFQEHQVRSEEHTSEL